MPPTPNEGLSVNEGDPSCSGSFGYREELPTAYLVLPVVLVIVVASLLVHWACMALAGLLFAATALRRLNDRRYLLDFVTPVGDLVPRPARLKRGHFRVVGSWLEVRRGTGPAERVFLPKARVCRQGHLLRVGGTLADVEVLIEGQPGDERALDRLAEGLVRAGERAVGTSRDVPAALTQLAKRAPESETR